ncbi:MAG: SGNH/GDSL hydrolase family protein [Microbacterium sp.]|uniref:SGNH/GDSL hydrolase family protein n=1 Tax=Microbacterium sp. TaxID=51671 RepID=UPI001AC5BB4E|nr:SGNH/GDSL hydrolase family protein [Microbacterium sp.]MBN9178415.1 SGNH/GDSL hydrolase family protein [Microbacterium sp.]
MRAFRVPSRRRPAWVLPVIALGIAAVLGAALWRPWTAAATPESVAAAGAGGVVAAASPEPLDLPENPTVLIVGDSWTYGSAASDPSLGYAYVVGALAGWTTVVDGVRGSGYLKPGLDGPDFGTRIAALDPALEPDLVIVQGSINDRREGAGGYRAAVDAAWNALARVYPRAQVVILGPAPQVLPVEAATARIDGDLRDAAAARGWWYVSPLAEEWITTENYAAVIDTGAGRDHPSTAGHRYLAERLAAAVASLAR